MSTQHNWNAHYQSSETPWDSDEPEPHLCELISEYPVLAGAALEVGCGTGTNARWLATQGFDVLAIDVAPLAIERAQQKRNTDTIAKGKLKLEQRDFLQGPELPKASFQLVFDRGCFHVFDDAEDQARFASRVADLLVPAGLWLSVIGSTEGPAREMSPPRRNARELITAIEPVLELVQLRSVEFSALPFDQPPRAWYCLSRKREVPAQPSSKLDQVTAAIHRRPS